MKHFGDVVQHACKQSHISLDCNVFTIHPVIYLGLNILIFNYLFKNITIVRIRDWSFGHSDPDSSDVTP